VPFFDTPFGNIGFYAAKKKEPLDKEFLKATISAHIQDEKVADNVVTEAFDNRPVTEFPKLKFVKKKGKR